MPNDVAFALDWTLQVNAANNGNGVLVNVGGLTGIGLQVTGTFVASIYPEGTIDGVTFPTPGLMAINLMTGVVANAITAPGLYFVPIPGMDQFRARVSNYVSGTNITVTGKGISAPSPFILMTNTPGGTPETVSINQVGGSAVALGQAAAAASIPVVLASNQSSIPVTGAADVTAAISLTALATAASIALNGTQSIGVTLTGTWVGTLTPQVSGDGGTTWAATQFYNPATQLFSATVSAPGTYLIVGTGGMSHAEVLVSAYTSGTITGTLRASAQADDVVTAQFAPSGQTTKSASLSVSLASDQFSSAVSPTRQPAGGDGPVTGLPLKSDLQMTQLATICDLLRELITIATSAMSP